ncbi:hypothetical protein TH53_16095 [Pedobacter lusitanus]|uniref:Uncharacterized protein n=1 Tax=Pedobacter lusitanus TaxID=1503925 RepID=A0A0D0GJC0_9SPHI|nr:hypothetical protein [Pedobacter lusitanus]KIO76235.1 hypothetical protein TH53_16095 [Pedobacter lusitanus]
MRFLFKLFALLDVISIVSMSPQIWSVLVNYKEIPGDATSVARVVLTLLIFFSLFVSAAGLFQFRKYGIITNYIQFPFRLLLFVFSIGFITLLPELFPSGAQWFGVLFRICIIAEFFRAFYVLQGHRKYFR